ncbi:Arm DNA-binding domain-containing protein [Adlercreutzia agrestimuris]|uniref:Arm DNA-binding domain-containing protein n=1 Tax=Adlercreutzia agrestimuris TaxID=2941324 RepID=UPI00203F47EE|nr:Arm DNA-binding domain-containing protein [Adlercreutzia agrestimuris]
MSVYKNRSTDCWWVSCRFEDTNGVARRTIKRGFKSEEEAKSWEEDLKASPYLRFFALSRFLRL